MSVYKPKGSEVYRYDFWTNGHRFCGTTNTTSKRAAERYEDVKKAEARSTIRHKAKGAAKLTLHHCAERFWKEQGMHHANADTTLTNIRRLEGYFGRDRELPTITDNDIAQLVAWRRGQHIRGKKSLPLVSAATVNRSTVQLLQAIFTRAKTKWNARFDNEPDWSAHKLKEPQERVRELSGKEADAIDAAMRLDYEPFFAFAAATGQRLRECLLKWSEVNWSTRQIVKTGKGGRTIVIPITDDVRDILWPLQGHDAEWVFTYRAKRTRKPQKLVKGQRYPITYSGAKSAWKRLRKDAGLVNFRFHDFRHDVGTKLLRETGNLKIVMKALNHADIKTTTKYAHVLDEEVAAALTRLQKSRAESRKHVRKAG